MNLLSDRRRNCSYIDRTIKNMGRQAKRTEYFHNGEDERRLYKQTR